MTLSVSAPIFSELLTDLTQQGVEPQAASDFVSAILKYINQTDPVAGQPNLFASELEDLNDNGWKIRYLPYDPTGALKPSAFSENSAETIIDNKGSSIYINVLPSTSVIDGEFSLSTGYAELGSFNNIEAFVACLAHEVGHAENPQFNLDYVDKVTTLYNAFGLDMKTRAPTLRRWAASGK